jgi:hypothetical protein
LLLVRPPALASMTGESSDHERMTARCVAALEADTDEVAIRVKAGRVELKPLLLERLRAGAAFVVDSYVKGERNEGRAKSILSAALEDQKTLARSELASRQSQCALAGARLLADSNFIFRAVVSTLAEKRMRKLLEDH